MIKLNTAYTIDNGDTVTFTEGKKGTINGAYKDATLTGAFDGNVLKATFHNTKVNATGLMEITFHENGFDAAWKKGLEPGPMRGKWEGILETSSDFNVSIPDDIKVLLEQHLIKPNVGIDAVYNWFFGYYKNQFNVSAFTMDLIETLSKNRNINYKQTAAIGWKSLANTILEKEIIKGIISYFDSNNFEPINKKIKDDEFLKNTIYFFLINKNIPSWSDYKMLGIDDVISFINKTWPGMRHCMPCQKTQILILYWF